MNPTWIYVAAVYLGAVWLARRSHVELPWRIAALFYGLTLIFLFRPMTGGWVSVPTDFIHMLPPWTSERDWTRTGNGALNDLALQIVPWAHQVRESWLNLEIPLWNGRSGSGYPLLGNGQSSAFSPLRLLSLPLSLADSFTAEAALKFLTALTFTYLLARRRGWSQLPCCVAAVSFGFSTFLVVWLHFPVVTVASLLPAAIYALELLVERFTWKRASLGAAVWAAILFGGHPETAAHIFVLCLLWLTWILFVERPAGFREAARTLLRLGGVMTMAALLAAPFLVAMAEGIPRSMRFHRLDRGGGHGEKLSDPRMLVILMHPYFFGDDITELVWGPSHPEFVTGFAGILGPAAVIALLVYTVLTRRFRTREAFLGIAGLAIAGNILDWPGVGRAVDKMVPFAANNRIRLLLGFVLALAAGAAVHLVIDRAAEWKARVSLLAGLMIVSGGLVWATLPLDFAPDWRMGGVVLTILPGIAVLATAALIASPGYRPFLPLILLAAVAVEMLKAGTSWNPPVSEHLFYRRTGLIRKLQGLVAATPTNEPFRIAGTEGALFPNTSAIYGLDDIRIHDPMANERYARLLKRLTGYEVDDYFANWRNAETPLLDFLNVRFLVDGIERPDLDPSRWKNIYASGDGAIYENLNVLPRFFPVRNVIVTFSDSDLLANLRRLGDWKNTAILRWLPVRSDQERSDLLAPRPPSAAEAKVTIVSASNSDYRLRVEAPRYSLVASSIPWWPGWKAWADGDRLEVLRVNEAFTGFVVPPGRHEVRVRFAPTSFRLAATASSLTLVALIFLSSDRLRGMVMRRRRE